MTAAVDALMRQALSRSVFPSASLLVAHQGEVLYHQHFGQADESKLFDIASLTKPIATATLCMLLVDEGKLKLDTEIESLLSHTSGIPAWNPYYQEIPVGEIGTPKAKKHILNAITNESRLSKSGEVCAYSDLGYILLGNFLEKQTAQPLDKLFETKIAKPLGLQQTSFGPVKNALPTEHCPWRNRVIQGEVHDQNGFAMGGVAGHAGLFSTAQDLHVFMKALTSAYRGQSDWISQKTAHRFLDFETTHGTFVLGWDTPTFGTSSCGSHFSPNSIGHLGFTGCSLWCDLDRDLWVIFLTNRTYPSATNTKIRAFRPRLHNLIWEEFFPNV